MKNYLPRRGCAQISGIKKPRQTAGLKDKCANRAVIADPVALPIHHLAPVTYEQICI